MSVIDYYNIYQEESFFLQVFFILLQYFPTLLDSTKYACFSKLVLERSIGPIGFKPQLVRFSPCKECHAKLVVNSFMLLNIFPLSQSLRTKLFVYFCIAFLITIKLQAHSYLYFMHYPQSHNTLNYYTAQMQVHLPTHDKSFDDSKPFFQVPSSWSFLIVILHKNSTTYFQNQ